MLSSCLETSVIPYAPRIKPKVFLMASEALHDQVPHDFLDSSSSSLPALSTIGTLTTLCLQLALFISTPGPLHLLFPYIFFWLLFPILHISV